MSAISVLRLDTLAGGSWCDTASCISRAARRTLSWSNLPNPQNDAALIPEHKRYLGCVDINPGEKCGCVSWEQFTSWWPEWAIAALCRDPPS